MRHSLRRAVERIVFRALYRHLSSTICKPLKTNATGGYLAHHAENTNEYACQKVNVRTGRQGFLVSADKRRKVSWFGHVCRHDDLPKDVLQGTLDGSRRGERPRTTSANWTGQSLLLVQCIADHGNRWAAITAEYPHRAPASREIA